MDVDEDGLVLGGEHGAKARAMKTGPKKFVSMFARMSASVTVRRLPLGGIAPALLISTVTSQAASATTWMEAESVTSRMSGDDAFLIPHAGFAGGVVDLARAAGQGFVYELGSDATVRSRDEDDGSVECGHVHVLSLVWCGPPGWC